MLLDPASSSTMVVVFFTLGRCLMWVVSLKSYYSDVGKTTVAWTIESFSAMKYKNN
jgi:hypothetical protein